MRKRTLRAGSTVAMAALVVSLGAVAGVLACSFIVSDKLPAYTCQPGAGPSVCPADQVCAPNQAHTQGTCTPRCTATSCSVDRLQCDSKSGLCVAPNAGGSGTTIADADAPSTGSMDATMDAGAMTGDADAATTTNEAGPCNDFGCGCASSSDCAPGFACVDKVATTADIWSVWVDSGGGGGSGDGRICMETCCTSGECDMSDGGGSGSQVCFATGAGGSYCVPPAWLGDRSTIGTDQGGSACADDAGTCRSGLCVSGVCADTCCSSRNTGVECVGGSVCLFGMFPGSGFDTHEAANCALPTASMRGTNGSNCMANSDCRSNLCAGGDAGTFGDMPTCRDACRNAADCTTSTRSTAPSCAYLQPLPGSTDLVAACTPTTRGAGDAGAGSSCQASSDCARGYCAPLGTGLSECLATCFSDTVDIDCQANERCRSQPLQVGSATYSVLACGM